MDCDWRESRLPWLDRVLICLVYVVLMQVSWAVRCLGKPLWTAVVLMQLLCVRRNQALWKNPSYNLLYNL